MHFGYGFHNQLILMAGWLTGRPQTAIISIITLHISSDSIPQFCRSFAPCCNYPSLSVLLCFSAIKILFFLVFHFIWIFGESFEHPQMGEGVSHSILDKRKWEWGKLEGGFSSSLTYVIHHLTINSFSSFTFPLLQKWRVYRVALSSHGKLNWIRKILLHRDKPVQGVMINY